MRDWKRSLAVVSALAMVATATASLNLSADAVTTDRFEFEDGTLDNSSVSDADWYATVGDSVEGYSGTGYVDTRSGNVSITVEAPSTGMYELTVAYHLPEDRGSKVQKLSINGVSQGDVSFTTNDGFEELSLGKFKLNEGENTVEIVNSWGWVMLDYLSVAEAETVELTADKTLSDSQATDEAKRLMSYLVDNYGEHIISGQQEIYKYGRDDFEWDFDYIYDLTGEYPAIRGFDYMNETNPMYGDPDGTTDRMIDWAKNKNGIVTASWHITVPKDFDSYNVGDSVAWSDCTYVPGDTNFDPSQILVEGSKEREYYMLCLKNLANSIQQLQDEGVPLIFRPLHEAEGAGGETGSWFWWGKSGSAVYKELWKLTYNTLTEDYGLHNIIWEWNSYAYSTSMDWYPGDEYVDIVGYDKYNCTDWSTGNAVYVHNDSAISGTFYNLVDMYPGKMVAMAENDSIPTLENLTSEKAGWLYFLPWYEDPYNDSGKFLTNPIFNTSEDLITIYQSDYCITLDEVPEDLYNTYSLDGFLDAGSSVTDSTETSQTEATETSESETSESETSQTEETTTLAAVDTSIDGKVLSINAEENTATIELDDGSSVTVPLDLLGDSISEDDSVNVRFEDGQPVSVTKLGSTTTPSETAVTTTTDSSVTTTIDTTTSEGSEETTTQVADSTSLKGDANGDGTVDGRDLILLKKYTLGLVGESGINLDNSDVTGDSSLDGRDLILLKKYILGLVETL